MPRQSAASGNPNPSSGVDRPVQHLNQVDLARRRNLNPELWSAGGGSTAVGDALFENVAIRDQHGSGNVVAFYNKRGMCEQWIKEGKGAIKWTRLSCRTFAANAVRLQLHALAYNLGNFLRTLATPEPIKDWSMTTLKERLIKIGAKVVSHGRYVAFQWPRSPSPGICSATSCG